MTKPVVYLNMIVKDEEKIIRRCVESYRGEIGGIIFYDTGSTDGTMLEASRACRDIEVECIYVVGEPFRNFSTSRNLALAAAKGVQDWDLLMLADADMTLEVVDPNWACYLHEDVDVAMVPQRNGWLEYFNTRVISRAAARSARYHGRTHEYLTAIGNTRYYTLIEFVDHSDGHNRSEKRGRDIELLQQDYKDGENPMRAAFYLAQTFREIGDYVKATQWYSFRMTMGIGWDEEYFYSLYGMCLCYIGLNNWELATEWANAAMEYLPSRAEPAYAMENAAKSMNRKEEALAWAKRRRGLHQPSSGLFVEHAAYQP